jgi:hypothetical protein
MNPPLSVAAFSIAEMKVSGAGARGTDLVTSKPCIYL